MNQNWKWTCVGGHDHCPETYPGDDCPYCERRPTNVVAMKPAPRPLQPFDFFQEELEKLYGQW